MLVARTMLTLRLPNLVAGRDLADQMLDRFGQPFDHRTVVVDARGTATGSPSFASQLVHRTLVEGNAEALVLVGAPKRFEEQVTESANRSQVSDRLHLTRDLPAAASVA